jgi:SHS family lactate transporter-like MFS transporter
MGAVHRISPANVTNIAMIYNVGAVLGAIIFGELSQRIGRRYSMITSLVVSLAVIPMWAFSHTATLLVVGAFLMQVGVQGTWGIIPVHLSELAPDAARGLVPGLAYQLGTILSAPTNNIEYALRDRVGYQWALAGFELVVIVALVVLLLLGTERHGRDFRAADTVASAD